MAESTTRAEPFSSEADLSATERLIAEEGLQALSDSDPEASAAAVRAIAIHHARHIDRLRSRMVSDTLGSTALRDWVACLVRPATDYLAALGTPSWYARFCAQVMTDPELSDLMIDAALDSPSLRTLLDNLEHCQPDLPPEIHGERAMMARMLITHMCLEMEQALAEGKPTLWSSWDHVADSLIDGLAGLWQAPAQSSADRGRA